MSTYTTFSEKPNSDKLVVFEIDLTETIPFWLCYESGIWQYKITNYQENSICNFENGAYCYGSFENGVIQNTGTNQIYKIINSATVDGSDYTAVTSMANLRSTNQSFYYDVGSTTIRFHFDSFRPPHSFSSISIGVTNGFSNKDIYLDDQFYQGKINSAPNISIKKNLLQFGIQQYGGGTVSMDNLDGYFDNFVNQSLFGQSCRLRLGDGTWTSISDFKKLKTGFIGNINIDEEKFDIDIFDEQRKLSRKLPVNYFNTTDWPNVGDDNLGKPIPLVWGSIRGGTAYSVNDDEVAPANYKFVIADITNHSIKTLSEVLIDGVAEAPVPALVNDTTDNVAYFLIVAGGNYDPGKSVIWTGSGFDDSAARDGSGSLIQGALDVIEDILDDYADTAYSVDTYDTTQWTKEKSYDKSIGLWVGESTEIKDILEKISISNRGNLIFTGDALWTFKRTDKNAIYQLIFRDYHRLNPINASYDYNTVLSNVTIRYFKNNDSNNYYEYTDNSNKAQVYSEHQTYNKYELETYLVNYNDAVNVAADILADFDSIYPTFKFETTIEATQLEIMDNIIIYLSKLDENNNVIRNWYGYVKCEVIGIDYDLTNFSTMLTCRYIEDWDEVFIVTTTKWTADAITFPAGLGGGDASVWDKNWSLAQKEYAKQNFGYWTNPSGYIDATDPDSYQGSQWQED